MAPDPGSDLELAYEYPGIGTGAGMAGVFDLDLGTNWSTVFHLTFDGTAVRISGPLILYTFLLINFITSKNNESYKV